MGSEVIVSSAEQTLERHNTALLGSETGQALNLRAEHVPPDGGPPLHMHTEQAETFYVAEGLFKFQIDEDELIGKKGMTIFIPKGTPHCYLNIAEEAGTLISVLTPGVHDGFILDVREAEQNGASIEELTALAEKNGTVIIGPPLKK